MDVSRGTLGRQVLPEGLVDLAPGAALAAMLAGIDRSRVAADDLRDLVRARARQVAFEQAELLADVLDAGRAALAEPESLERAASVDEKYAADVVSWMLYVTPAFAQTRLDLAQTLIHRLPDVYAALRAGALDLAKAAAFVDGLSGVTDDEVARLVASRLLGRAREWNLSQLRERLRYHVDRADPRAARRRYRKAVAERGVALRADADGTAGVSSWGLPPQRAAAAFDRVDRLARAARQQGDARTLRQLRADAYLDLLIGNPFQLVPSVDPLTALADGQFPPDPDDGYLRWEEEREPLPPQWFHAPRPEEAPAWWRTATHRRPRPALTPEECERRADAAAAARTEHAVGGDSTDAGPAGSRSRREIVDRLLAMHSGGPRFAKGTPSTWARSGSRFVTGTAADLPDDEDPFDHTRTDGTEQPDPPWWRHAATTRPVVPFADRETEPTPDPVLPGDRCRCGRLLPRYHRGSVELQLKLSTLMELDDDPGLIPGFGPVIADIARQVALDRDDPAWTFSVFGDTAGALLHHGYTRRRPAAKEAAFVRARDRSCRTPSCRRRASRAELDHRRPHTEGGASHRMNIDCLCGPHHDLREQPGVAVTRDGHAYTITLPCGNTYPVGPDKDLVLVNEQ